MADTIGIEASLEDLTKSQITKLEYFAAHTPAQLFSERLISSVAYKSLLDSKYTQEMIDKLTSEERDDLRLDAFAIIASRYAKILANELKQMTLD